jgi:hypothetical protein
MLDSLRVNPPNRRMRTRMSGRVAGCVKKTRKRHALRKMEVDPPESPCRGRLQTAVSCFDGIHLIDAPHYTGLGFVDHVGGERLFRLADISVALGSAAHYAHLPGMGTVSLATPRALQDLGSFVFRDHALELN